MGRSGSVYSLARPRRGKTWPGWNAIAPKHDAEFPQHPVARVRRVLAHVSATLVLSAHVKELPGFALPPSPD